MKVFVSVYTCVSMCLHVNVPALKCMHECVCACVCYQSMAMCARNIQQKGTASPRGMQCSGIFVFAFAYVGFLMMRLIFKTIRQ